MHHHHTFHRLLVVGLTASLLAAPRAQALTITAASCTQQADNLLRYDCSVTTDSSAQVHIELCEGRRCTFDRTSEVSEGTSHTITLWNLAPDTRYEWQVRAADGGAFTRAGPHSFTTASLADLDGDGVDDPDLAAITLGVSSSGSHETEQLLFNFACQAGGSDPGFDYLIVADDQGRIVWYQDPADAIGVDSTIITGLAYEPERSVVWGILDSEYIVAYALDGTLDRVMCRCDGRGRCPSGVTPDVCFSDLVHHDLLVRDGELWAVTAQPRWYADVEDCNRNGATTDAVTYIMDGINVWDQAGNLIVDWDLSSVYTPSGCEVGGYWDKTLPYSQDFAHANSLWVGDDERWILSLRHLDAIIAVEGDPASADYGSLAWVLSGDSTDTSDDWTLLSSAGLRSDFSEQHHAYWTPDGTLLIYDNHVVRGFTSRVIELDLDDASATADIIAEYDLGVSCWGQGSGYLTAGGAMVTTCSDDWWTGPVDPWFAEYAGPSSTAVWRMDVGCARGSGFRGKALYRGIPIDPD
jgi:hypothetical protein